MANKVRIKLLDEMYENTYVPLKIDGISLVRRVYYRRDVGLYIRVGGREYYKYELEIGKEKSFLI